jgi:hypothetical protein
MAFMLIFRIAPALSAFAAWFCYLSLTVAGQDFLQFQWDGLLLEAGFLAIFLSPLQWTPREDREPPVSRMVIWLYRWLLFRLILLAGLVKLVGGDPTWHNLTALQFHYWTQPLPPWTAWYANLLPNWFQQFSVVCVLFAELVVPFFFFAPRQLRKLAFGFTVALQLLIIVTGNYGFFNWLTIVLSLLLLDDTFWPFNRPSNKIKIIRRPVAAPKPLEGTPLDESPPVVPNRPWDWPRLITVPLAIFLVIVTSVAGLHRIHNEDWIPQWAANLETAVQPFRSANSYGLFEQMTTHRPEIIIEGSNDGLHWKAYEFKYKPGDVKHRPEFCAPYMPRLDWQMWFAGNDMHAGKIDGWIAPFLKRLLDGSPQVADLMEKSPFGDRPPRFVRATLYMYEFTNFAKGNSTGEWWWTFDTKNGIAPVRLNADGQFTTK